MADKQHFLALSATGASLSVSLTQHVQHVHAVVCTRYPAIDRIALAPYDPISDTLKTFVSSDRDGARLEHYEARMQDVPSLRELAAMRQIRVVDDIDEYFPGDSLHTRWLKGQNFRSSLTIPVFLGAELAGFLFFDSRRAGAFDAQSVRFLETFSGLVTQQYLKQLQLFHGIEGTVQLARGLAAIRDSETGQHLDRVSAYSRLIATSLAAQMALDDEFVAYVSMFAQLHDIGKIGIPDTILLKPGRLDAQERAIIETHVEIGESIVDQMAKNLQMDNSLALRILRNIVAGHHERGDGSGYPRHLKMPDIPLEARIVAVADAYDALANVRPYKRPWSEAAIAAEFAADVALGKLDAACVHALLSATEQRAAIRRAFVDQ